MKTLTTILLIFVMTATNDMSLAVRLFKSNEFLTYRFGQQQKNGKHLNIMMTYQMRIFVYCWHLQFELDIMVKLQYWFRAIKTSQGVPPPRYSWNIVESGGKHHNPNPTLVVQQCSNFGNIRVQVLKNDSHSDSTKKFSETDLWWTCI